MSDISEDALFPDHVLPELRSNLTNLANQTKNLSKVLLRCISLALGQNQSFFQSNHSRVLGSNNASKIRSLFYPRIDSQDLKPGLVRCGEHSDYGTITFLYNDDLGGLEVRAVDGSWLRAKPLPGSILVNVGDLLEIFSDGLFPATLHRVVIPEEETVRKKPRQSIVFFVHPDGEAVCKPLIKSKGTTKNNPITAKDHVTRRFAETFQED